MSRSERWNTKNEILQRFQRISDQDSVAGVPVFRGLSDGGEAHAAIIGSTGTGKSQCCSNPFEREVLAHNESLIMLDPKGEGYRQNACYIPDHYQQFCIDFRTPRHSQTQWNPLMMAYRLYKSADPDDHDIASKIISDLWEGVYPLQSTNDAFWPKSAADYATGLTYALFDLAPESQVNLDSVAAMMEASDHHFGSGILLKNFYEMLPQESLARRHLAAYVSACADTRASIHAVASSGLSVFSRSRGLMEQLSRDTLNILDLDVHRPFILTIITPDESDVYDALSGLLVSQVTQHLIHVAQNLGGRLPIRVNVILEELGSVGKAIPNLPNLMVASRSRNMRLMLVLQSLTQLEDVYSKSKAETIASCIGITIGFKTNSWPTLNEWSQRCGERQVERNGHTVKEPLITPTQLAAMPTGTALVMVDHQYKFITKLPFYNETYDTSDWKPPKPVQAAEAIKLDRLDFEELVKTLKRQEIEAKIHGSGEGLKDLFRPPFQFSASQSGASEPSFARPFVRPILSGENDRNEMEHDELDIQRLIESIDEKIAAIEAEELAEAKRRRTPECKVQVVEMLGDRIKLAKLIEDHTDLTHRESRQKAIHLPAELTFRDRMEATMFVRRVAQIGGRAEILPQKKD